MTISRCSFVISYRLVAFLAVAGAKTIALNASHMNGDVLQSFAQINAGPLAVKYEDDSTTLTAQYQQLGISMVRTHDFFGPTDISVIFPDFSADPELEENYDFSQSDIHIASIVNGGFAVLYRLGESADTPLRNGLPSDVPKWAQICKHIVMHYNDGWADGFQYNITYFEIWNEPDLTQLSASDYYELYNVTSRVLKEYDSSLKVGGPSISSLDTDESFTTGFVQFVVDNGLELDFFDWHNYPRDPAELYNNALSYRKMLDDFGLTECLSFNTEWNIWIGTNQRSKENSMNAAFTASSLMVMQEHVDLAFRYRGPQDRNFLLRMMGFDLSLFSDDGRWKRPALSHLAMKIVAETSPNRLFATSTATDGSDPITYLAGMADDGSVVNVLISNLKYRKTKIDLQLTNLPFAGDYTVARYEINAHKNLDIVDTVRGQSSTEYSTSFRIKRNSVLLVHLTTKEELPSEGPNSIYHPGWFSRIPLVSGFFLVLARIFFAIVF